MELTNAQKDDCERTSDRNHLKANPRANPEGLANNNLLQYSQLPWGAWLFEQARMTSDLTTSTKRKMSVNELL